MTWICSACQNHVEDSIRECPVCGHPRESGSDTQILSSDNQPTPSTDEQATSLLRVTCPRCGTSVLPGLEVCPQCETPMVDTERAISMPAMEPSPTEKSGKIKIKIKQPSATARDASLEEDLTPPRIDERLLSFESMDLEDTRLIRPAKTSETPASAPPSPPQTPPIHPSSPPSSPETPPESGPQSTTKPEPVRHPSRTFRIPLLLIPVWVVAFLVGSFLGYLIFKSLLKPSHWIIEHPAEVSDRLSTEEESEPSSTEPPVSTTPEPPESTMPYGRLTVHFPLYAHVYLDNIFLGLTPLIQYPVPAGQHTVHIVLPDDTTIPPNLRRQSFRINVTPRQQILLEPEIRLYGRLYLNSYPWSVVYLDGKRVGTTPLILSRVPIGSHTLRLKTSSGKAFETTIYIEENAITRFSHRFQSIE